MKAIVIKYKRIEIRHMLASDLPTLLPVLTNPETRGIYNPTRIASPHAIEKRFHDDGFSNADHEMLLVCDAEGAVIGDVMHFGSRGHPGNREVGWNIHSPAQRNQGYATEAVSALMDYLFQAYPLNRLECLIAASNLASLRLAQKCGFTREGVLRGCLFVGGIYLDGAVLSVLRSEWSQGRASSHPDQ
jgi:RimJ/RimL family protein N-acetyltransferase